MHRCTRTIPTDTCILAHAPNCTVCGLYLHKTGLSRHMKSHQQQQPASTCGQCGKTFSRQDNLVKHLRHCTAPPQQRQQQHTTTPRKFTINHQYTSMGSDVERYSINMQETQHLHHLSTALHLLLPSMKTFRTEHHTYKTVKQP